MITNRTNRNTTQNKLILLHMVCFILLSCFLTRGVLKEPNSGIQGGQSKGYVMYFSCSFQLHKISLHTPFIAENLIFPIRYEICWACLYDKGEDGYLLCVYKGTKDVIIFGTRIIINRVLVVNKGRKNEKNI